MQFGSVGRARFDHSFGTDGVVCNEPELSTFKIDQRAVKAAWPKLTPARAAIAGLAVYLLVYLSWQFFHWLPGKQQLGQAFLIPADMAALGATLLAALLSAGIGSDRVPALVAAALAVLAGVCSVARLNPALQSQEHIKAG